jgi:hypothetical protein
MVRRVHYWNEGAPVGRRPSVQWPWKEPAADDLPPPPSKWTPLSPEIYREWRQWAEQYVAHRSEAYGPRAMQIERAYGWRRLHFFKQWARDEIDIGERNQDGELQPITIYPASERGDPRNFKLEPGRMLHLVTESVGRAPRDRRLHVHAVHYDVHYRRSATSDEAAPAPPSPRRKLSQKALVKEITAMRLGQLERGEKFTPRKELAILLNVPEEHIRVALQELPPELRSPPGRRRGGG